MITVHLNLKSTFPRVHHLINYCDTYKSFSTVHVCKILRNFFFNHFIWTWGLKFQFFCIGVQTNFEYRIELWLQTYPFHQINSITKVWVLSQKSYSYARYQTEKTSLFCFSLTSTNTRIFYVCIYSIYILPVFIYLLPN